jgi:hypothetical protein
MVPDERGFVMKDGCPGCLEIAENASKYWDRNSGEQVVICPVCGSEITLRMTAFDIGDPQLEAQLRRYLYDLIEADGEAVSEDDAAEIEKCIKEICLEADERSVKN